MKRQFKPIRTYIDDHDKLRQMCREISVVQGKDVKLPELIRRTLNVPDLRSQLLNDAEIKRRMGR